MQCGNGLTLLCRNAAQGTVVRDLEVFEVKHKSRLRAQAKPSSHTNERFLENGVNPFRIDHRKAEVVILAEPKLIRVRVHGIIDLQSAL
ncbi:hypothetical protein XH83_22615 [Bradyrhizobium sp. CCBAU 53351]|nr:hypothetical protein XH83_22615 [Bradyrhizobium sp. CCBAU 53351]